LPFDPLALSDNYDSRTRSLPVFQLLIAVADSDTQEYLWVIRETMARVSEVNRLTWDDIDLENSLRLISLG